MVDEVSVEASEESKQAIKGYTNSHCPTCTEPVYRPPSQRVRYCSNICFRNRNSKRPRFCKRCKTPLMGEAGKNLCFCSAKCRDLAKTGVTFKHKSLEQRFWPKVDKSNPDGCWLWTGATNRQGYGHLGPTTDAPFTVLAHRLSYIMHQGPIPDGMFGCHRCDNKLCVRPDHIFLGTPKDNTQDMVRKGRQRFIANLPLSTPRLTRQEISDIKILSLILRYDQIVPLFDVHRSTVQRAATGCYDLTALAYSRSE